MDLSTKKIAVIGLGYVGLPLAVEFAKFHDIVGFDIKPARIEQLKNGHDETREVTSDELLASRRLGFTSSERDLEDCQIFIVTVPTPIDGAKRPDLTPLKKASETVGRALKKGGVVIYESTVFPGCTRNVCVPILEAVSGLRFNEEFYTGYSPERVNPGDKLHRIPLIKKVTSGSTTQVADAVDALYGRIITAGTFKAANIEVAEAAKVIENTQRDLNIALMNELAIIFERLGIDTNDVLEAAGTKWNFLPFRPGLVGGHCIGVDPYYLTHRAQEAGYHPEVILAGRRINDGMGPYVANRVSRLMMKNGFPVVGSRILVMGLSFKEDCPDLRNSKVIDVIRELDGFNAKVDVHDPWVLRAEASQEYGIDLLDKPPEPGQYDAIILTVGHQEFIAMGAERIRQLGRPGAVFFDVKGIFEKNHSDGRL
ncbi:MAG: nucleotide sugar dehydrogenase [Rhizobiaceae bacterium]|nr:nucleotide sugar dehydrogenase [Rhizobiaceae bacterium]